MSTAEGVTCRPAGPGDVQLLTRMLWIAFNWRDETASEDRCRGIGEALMRRVVERPSPTASQR